MSVLIDIASARPAGSMRPDPRIVAGRDCGTCTLCCKVVAVEEVAKPNGVWCRHCVAGKRCTIYASRPQSCREFYCQWMMEKGLGPEWKPERAKFALVVNAGGHITAFCDPGLPGAWRKSPYYETMKRWAAEGVRANPTRIVMVRTGLRGMVVLPDREVDIGTVGPGESIRLEGKQDGSIEVHKLKTGA
jgi:hypothetical protein